MLIGLIADTHIRNEGYKAGLSQLFTQVLPVQIRAVFENVDLILHAGDIYTLPVLDELEKNAPVLASEGDDDPFEVMNDRRIKLRHELLIEGMRIWLLHEYETIHFNWYKQLPDIIVFGHTHKAAVEKEGQVTRINPGSPTFPDYQERLGTVALLEVMPGKVDTQIIQLRS